jgi:sphingomyelin phosphodiesterase acid-like 3
VSKFSRCMFLPMLAGFYLLFGCSNGANTNPASAATTFPVVVFSDLHFNPFYDPTLFVSNPTLCTTADPHTWASIFQTSTITTPSVWGTDTKYPLLVLALASITQNLGASPLVIYTGDRPSAQRRLSLITLKSGGP